MCSKEEVRQVVRSEAPSRIPPTLLAFGMTGVLIINSWLLFNANETGKVILEAKRVNEVALAILTGEVKRLSDSLTNIKEVAISRSSDRYTGSQARRDKALINEKVKNIINNTDLRHDMSQERQNRQDIRLSEVEKQIKKYHNK